MCLYPKLIINPKYKKNKKKQRNEYIPMSALSQGIYIITITNENGVFREKLIKK